MADFSNQNVGGIQNPITPVAPVVDNSSVFNSQASSVAIGGIAQAFEGISNAIVTSNNAKAVTAFSQQQLVLADAVDQGLLTSQAARMRMRANFVAATSSSPSLTKDFAEVQKTIVTTSGLGKVIAEGTEQEKAQIKILNDAESSGFGRSEEGVENYLQFQRNSKEVQAAVAEIGLQKKISELEESNQKANASRSLAKLASSSLPAFTNTMDSIRDNNPGASPEELIGMYTAAYAQVQSISQQVGAAGGQDRIKGLLKPLDTLFQNYVDNANGSISNTALKNAKENAVVRNQLQIMGSDDGELLDFISTSLLFPNADVVATQSATNLHIKTIKKLSEQRDGVKSTVNITDADEDMSPVFSTLLSNMKKQNNGTSSGDKTENKEEIDRIVSNINGSVVRFADASDSPKDYKQALSFYASSDYGKYSTTNGPAENADRALSVLERNYTNVLIPLVKKELADKKIFLLTPRPSSQFIVAEFVNGSMRFKPNPNPTDESLAKRGGFSIRDEVNRLNRIVAGPVNEIVRASAHINGNQDYQKVWDQQLAPALGLSVDGGGLDTSELEGLLSDQGVAEEGTNPPSIIP